MDVILVIPVSFSLLLESGFLKAREKLK